MLVDRYKQSNRLMSALFVPTGTPISALPAEVAERWKDASCDAKGDSLTKTEPRVGLNVAEAIENIERSGYYEATAAIRFDERITQK